jgi:hypothetical protein
MGFFDAIFGGKSEPADPAKAWAPKEDTRLVVSLDDHTVNGAPLIGAHVDELHVLGPPENDTPTKVGSYDWYSQGYCFEAPDEEYAMVLWLFTNPTKEYKPFTGSIVLGGQPIAINADTAWNQVEALMGEAFHKTKDDDSFTLWYEFGGEIEWQFRYTLDDKLDHIYIVSMPTLADPECRAEFGCTRPWPW